MGYGHCLSKDVFGSDSSEYSMQILLETKMNADLSRLQIRIDVYYGMRVGSIDNTVYKYFFKH